MSGLMRPFLLLCLLVSPMVPANPDGAAWEYQVVVLQGVTAGGTIEKQANGVAIDKRKTKILNELAAQGWEIIAVVGAPVTDHAIYLRRKPGG